MNTIEPRIDRQASLREYLNQELEDILTIKPGSLLFKSRRRKGVPSLVFGLTGIIGSLFCFYSGLSQRNYVYGYGLYIMEPAYQDWIMIVLGIALLLSGIGLLVHWLNTNRTRLNIYVTNIKGIGVDKGTWVAMPVNLNLSQIRQISRRFNVLTIETEHQAIQFRIPQAKKAYNLLKMQLETFHSLHTNESDE